MTFVQRTASGSTPVNVRNYFAGYVPAGGIEVPSTLPTLTWDFGTPQALSTATDLDDLINAIDAAVTATADNWRVLDKKLSTDPAPWDGGAAVGILIGGPVGSPVEYCRILIATSSSGPTDTIAANARASTISGNGNNDANGLWCGFAPDAGAAGFNTFGAGATDVSDGGFLSSSGVNERAFKGQRETGLSSYRRTPSVDGIDSVTAWANEEMLMLLPMRGIVVFCLLAGATIIPPSDDAAEPDGRIYAMHHANYLGLESASGRWPGTNGFANTAKAYAFNPVTPATSEVVELASYGNIDNLDSPQNTPSGPKLALPLILQQMNGTPDKTYGWMRQIGQWGQAVHGDPVTNKDGATVGLLLAGNTGGTLRAFAVTNLGNQG
jgi:hypothetical protein